MKKPLTEVTIPAVSFSHITVVALAAAIGAHAIKYQQPKWWAVARDEHVEQNQERTPLQRGRVARVIASTSAAGQSADLAIQSIRRALRERGLG